MRERTHLDTAVNGYRALERELSDSIELIEMGEAEGDETVVKDAENTLLALKDKAAKLELESLLSGEADANDCYVEVNAGAGGTEAQDWAEMLLRMYLRWAEAHGYKTEWLEESAGEEAGIKSATVQIKGHNAYGWLKTEAGVHRLVRISPYDSQARRHTSFASVAVSPVIDDKIAIEVLDKDLRIDTYRASGAGGQHINKTDSAVRITHIPTNIVVQCQQERSQHKNRAKAFDMLRARLYEAELKKREDAAAALGGDQVGYRLGAPNPLLRVAALPDGEGSQDRCRNQPERCRSGWRYRRVPGCRSGPAHQGAGGQRSRRLRMRCRE